MTWPPQKRHERPQQQGWESHALRPASLTRGGSAGRARSPSPFWRTDSPSAREQSCGRLEQSAPVKRARVGRLDPATKRDVRMARSEERPELAARTDRRHRSGNSRSSPSFGSATASVMLVSVTCRISRDMSMSDWLLGRTGQRRTHLVHDALDLCVSFVPGGRSLRLGSSLTDSHLRDELGWVAVTEAVRRQLRVAVEGARASKADKTAPAEREGRSGPPGELLKADDDLSVDTHLLPPRPSETPETLRPGRPQDYAISLQGSDVRVRARPGQTVASQASLGELVEGASRRQRRRPSLVGHLLVLQKLSEAVEVSL